MRGRGHIIFLSMAEENGISSIPIDFPVKTARGGEDNGGGGVSVEIEDANSNKDSGDNNISAVILGWFSEISPMWPGEAHSLKVEKISLTTRMLWSFSMKGF